MNSSAPYPTWSQWIVKKPSLILSSSALSLVPTSCTTGPSTHQVWHLPLRCSIDPGSGEAASAFQPRGFTHSGADDSDGELGLISGGGFADRVSHHCTDAVQRTDGHRCRRSDAVSRIVQTTNNSNRVTPVPQPPLVGVELNPGPPPSPLNLSPPSLCTLPFPFPSSFLFLLLSVRSSG